MSETLRPHDQRFSEHFESEESEEELSVATFEEWRKLYDQTEELDQAANTHPIELVASLGIDISKIEPLPDGLFCIQLPDGHKIVSPYDGKELPGNYALKGGAARCLLLQSLELDPSCSPRDYDIARFDGDKSHQAKRIDDMVAKSFMPEDDSHGFGIEADKSAAEYLKTRDLTINEVYATNKALVLTQQCLTDTIRNILRLTDNAVLEEKIHNRSKWYAKALRMYAVALNNQSWAFPDMDTIDGLWKTVQEELTMPGFEKNSFFISPFWLALHLDRAVGQGGEVAANYLELLQERTQLPQWIQSPGQAVAYLDRLLSSRPFSFRNASASAGEIEVEREMYRYIYEENLPYEQDSDEELYGDEPQSIDDVPEAHEESELLDEELELKPDNESGEPKDDKERWIDARKIKGLRAVNRRINGISKRKSGR